MFKGTGTAILTPFNTDLSVDYSALKKNVRFQLDNNIDALIVLGTTGEAATIDFAEREKIIDTVIQENTGQAKIIIGTGTNDTKHVVKFNMSAEKYNADGVLIVNPYYNKSTQKGIIEHYRYISEHTNLPIILYNVPSRTGMNILPETALTIQQKCTNVIAIKEASGDISQIAKLIALKPDSFAVYSGNDDQTLPVMALGAQGVISVFSNAYPKEMKKLTNAILTENYPLARKLNNSYLPMMNALFIESSPAPIKYVLNRMGMLNNILRLPMISVSENSQVILNDLMNKMK